MTIESALATVAIVLILIVGQSIAQRFMPGHSEIRSAFREQKAARKSYISAKPSAYKNYLVAHTLNALGYFAMFAGAPLFVYASVAMGAAATALGILMYVLGSRLLFSLDREAAEHHEQNLER